MAGLLERIKEFIIGCIVGMASILPGLSGAVIAAIFGVYERIVDDIGDLRHKIKKDFRFLAVIGSGLVVGAIFFSIVYERIPPGVEFIAYALFIGMIAGQLPDVYSLAREGESRVTATQASWFLIGLAAIMVIIIFQTFYGMERFESDGTAKAFMLIVVVGVIFSAGGLLPGLSAPTVLLALGLQNMMTSALANLDLPMIAVFSVGVLIGVFGFAKLIDSMLKNHRSATYFGVLGLTFGSIFTIIPHTDGWNDVILCIAAGLVGFMISAVFSYFGKKRRMSGEDVNL